MRRSMPWRRAHSGLTLLEVLMVGIAAVIVGLPILVLISKSGEEATVSEDYMLAETLAERHIQEILALSWQELDGRLPIDRKLSGIPPGDEDLAKTFDDYRLDMTGPDSFTGTLTAKKIEDGLVGIEVLLEWSVVPGSVTKRQYSVLRLMSRPDLSIGASYTIKAFEPEKKGGS